MAGSNKWFVYTTDAGQDFAIFLDESNTEAVNGQVQDYLDNATFPYTLPKNVKPRTLIYKNQDGSRTIRCVALTRTIFDGALANVGTITDPIGGGNLVLSQTSPEKLSPLPRGFDSGLNDGDAT